MFSAGWNPPNRFEPREVEWLEAPLPERLVVQDDHSRTVLNRNRSPDVGFNWSVNPYRGCTHACAYCYARPGHELLGWGAGSDFERRILVKKSAPELLERALLRPSWRGEPIAFSGVTDCYQPLERRYAITRQCLSVCARYRNPVLVITRSPLVVRDVDILASLALHNAVRVTVSIPVPDPILCRLLEPGAPPPSARYRAIRELSDAGIPVGVSVSPVIMGLNDRLIPEALKQARAAGAQWAWTLALRLPGAVAVVFERRLREALPERADTILKRIRRSRDGALNDPRFGHRMRGSGASWEMAKRLFQVWHDRLGFEAPPAPPSPTPFCRPQPKQLALFQDNTLMP